ncbi:MAG TPA: alkaline phosphatase PhoX [Cyanobium sp.]|nr:alkaline phosphatase PhoX [Cyanobium sp.]
MNRRDLLALLGLGAAAAAAPPALAGPSPSGTPPFRPVRVPLPVPGDGLAAAEQRQVLRQLTLDDRLVVPDGYRSELLVAWGDPVADGRFGFNNDHIAFTDLGGGRALLTVNFEYISPLVWGEGFAEAVGRALPLRELSNALAAGDPLAAQVREVATAAMEDLGIGVIELQRQPDGSWRRRRSPLERRITGLTGLEDPATRLRVSGPAAAVFRAGRKLGYDDGLGEGIIGSFANCAGGETPWGTVLSAEENFQSQVCEAVFADGSSPSPAERPFTWSERRVEGLGHVFGLAGNKYGWMVEIDPRRPERPPVKHSWLGRFRHEAVAVKAEKDRPLLVYSGCDRHGGHLYRFVSEGRITDPNDPANSRLFEAGRLEVARFDAGGGGRWIPLDPLTPVDPLRPSHFAAFELRQATVVPHADRGRAGSETLASDGEVEAYRSRYPTLADLYPGTGEAQRGAILIDAHLAANAVGATPAARPEDTVIDPTSGDLLIAFTAGGSDEDGTADPAVFRGPGGETTWPHGWIMRLQEAGDGRFRWRLVATGGTPWQGGLGFSNPDNLVVDRSGNIWMLTDRSTRSSSLDVFGNNSCWVLPRSGPAAGQALCFATGPMESELCGPCFDTAQTTLFLAVQHPGEDNGTRLEGAQEAQAHALVDREGQPFEQLRWVPLGSNWPSGVPGRAPRPGLVAIRRLGGGPLLGG